MIDKRLGDYLWVEWPEEENIYYTPEHVDFEEEIVRRALASTLQRDGIVDSLFQGFELFVEANIKVGWMGSIAGERELVECSEDGETPYGEVVEQIQPCTWVEISH